MRQDKPEQRGEEGRREEQEGRRRQRGESSVRTRFQKREAYPGVVFGFHSAPAGARSTLVR